jgi:hypothetical protein
VSEEDYKQIEEYIHHLELCKKYNSIAIEAIMLSNFADWIEKGEHTDIIVKCFRDLVEIFGKNKEEE